MTISSNLCESIRVHGVLRAVEMPRLRRPLLRASSLVRAKVKIRVKTPCMRSLRQQHTAFDCDLALAHTSGAALTRDNNPPLRAYSPARTQVDGKPCYSLGPAHTLHGSRQRPKGTDAIECLPLPWIRQCQTMAPHRRWREGET